MFSQYSCSNEEYIRPAFVVLELNYDKKGLKSGSFKYARFGAVIQGVFENDVAKFNLPDSIMKQIADKERFVQARHIRKNDYKTIKNILSTIPHSQDSIVDNGEVYVIVEDPPIFPGDKSTISKFLTLHLVYPKQAKDKGVTGKVFIQFTIMADGTVDDVQVVKGIGFG